MKTDEVDEPRGTGIRVHRTYDVLAIVFPAIQDQGDHQNEWIQSAALDRVPDDASVESVHPMVRSELHLVLGLFDPPDDEACDDEVGCERDGEESRGDILDSRDKGGLAGGEF